MGAESTNEASLENLDIDTNNQLKELLDSIMADGKINADDLEKIQQLVRLHETKREGVMDSTWEALAGELEKSFQAGYTVTDEKSYEALKWGLRMISRVRNTPNIALRRTYEEFKQRAGVNYFATPYYSMSSFVLKMSNDGQSLDLYPCHGVFYKEYRYARTLNMNTGDFSKDTNRATGLIAEREDISDNNNISFSNLQLMIEQTIRFANECLRQKEISDEERRMAEAQMHALEQAEEERNSGRCHGSPQPRVNSDAGVVAPDIPQAPQSAPPTPSSGRNTPERPEILCNLDIGENYNRATWKKKADIILIQTILQQTVNPALKIDGVWGPITTQAVADFQYDNQLVIDGKVGGDTTAKLNEIGGTNLVWQYPGKSRNPQANMPCNIRT